MLTPEQVGRLMFRYTRNELTPKEALELGAWRRLSERNEQFFLEETDPENLKRNINEIYASKDAIFKKIMDRYKPSDQGVQNISGIRNFPSKPPRSGIYRILRVAAVIVVSLGVTLYVLFGIDFGEPDGKPNNGLYHADLTDGKGITVALGDMKRGYADGYAKGKRDKEAREHPFFKAVNHPQAPAGEYNTLRTAKGARFGLELPDGARIRFNELTSVKYPANYVAGSSEIIIEGEVFVELEDNKNVNTVFHASLRNMKLSSAEGLFNIKAYPGDSVQQITLIKGDMKIQSAGGNGQAPSEILLQPGDQAQLVNGKLIVRQVDIQKVLEWKNKSE